MRIALVTDIHGNLAALDAVVADIRSMGVDQIANLGDRLSGPLSPLETAQYLMAEGWLTLAGNHERQLLSPNLETMGASDRYAHSRLSSKESEWLKTLPKTVQLSDELFLCHGTPLDDITYFLETVEQSGVRPATSAEVEFRLGSQSSLVVGCGHTHVPRVVRAASRQLIVNPGSVGLPAYSDIHPYAHSIETGSPDARYAIVEKTRSGWSASLRCVPYDYESMAKLARARGRTDWEHALLTGYTLQDA